MKRLICFGLLLWTTQVGIAQTESGPVLKSFDRPVYPPIARLARVEGRVDVEFLLNGQGQPVSVSAVSGPRLLRGAAEAFVKTWKFDSRGATPVGASPYRTSIQFKLVHIVVDPRSPANLVIHEDSYRHFEVTATFSDEQLSECPTGADEQLSECPTGADEQVPTETNPEDFVEVSRSGCYGSCPSYTVRVRADGGVSWNGYGYVEARGARRAHVDAAAARALIERFRTQQFWSLCGLYTQSVTDSVTTTVAVKMGGRMRSVSDYADSAPAWVQELELAIDEVSNSHLWRHGNPVGEPITRLSPDSYLPKPGVTHLMRAAANAEMDTMRAIMRSGVDLNQTDASGWSALFYAMTSPSSEPVEVLLRAGADPNQSSFGGDTPLIACASEGGWDCDLISSGARVNARNHAGQTALMFLAASVHVDKIRDALKAGADPWLKDAKGRTALEYLDLAGCGKSPLADPLTNDWMSTGNRKCTGLDADDFLAAKKLLVAAAGRGK